MISLSEYKGEILKSTVRETEYSATVSSHYYNNEVVSTIVRSFTENGKMHLTRNDIFQEQNLTKKLVKILVWGYPGDVRNTPTIMSKLNELENLQHLYESKIITGERYLTALLKINRLGVSTASKILYFMEVKIGGYPAIIIDARVNASFPIIKELSNLSDARNEKSYILANTTIGELAKNLKLKSEQIEYFLFNLGKVWESHVQSVRIQENRKADKQLIDSLLREEEKKNKKKVAQNQSGNKEKHYFELTPGLNLKGRTVDFGYEILVGGLTYYLFIGHTSTFHYCELLTNRTKRKKQPISDFPRIQYLREHGFHQERADYIYRRIENYEESSARSLLEEIKKALLGEKSDRIMR